MWYPAINGGIPTFTIRLMVKAVKMEQSLQEGVKMVRVRNEERRRLEGTKRGIPQEEWKLVGLRARANGRAKGKGLIVTVIQCCMWDRSMTAED